MAENIEYVLPSPPASPTPDENVTMVTSSAENMSEAESAAEDSPTRSRQAQDLRQGILDQFKVTCNDVKWSDVIGLKEVKERLLELVILPARFPQLFTGMRSRSCSGRILLYGIPGSGKTMLIKALVNEIGADCTLLHVPAQHLMSRLDECTAPEKMNRLFQTARSHTPAVILIEEVEEFCNAETGFVIGSLINNLDYGTNSEVVVVLSCLDPNKLWRQLRRRFPYRLYVKLPDVTTRAEILRNHFTFDLAWELTSEDYMEIAAKTDGWTGADLFSLSNSAAKDPVRDLLLAINGDENYFRLVPRSSMQPSAPVPDPDSDRVYVRCASTDPGAEKLQLDDLNSSNVHLRSVSLEDLKQGLEKMWPTQSRDDVKKLEKFHRDFGPDECKSSVHKQYTEVEPLKNLSRRSLMCCLRSAFDTHRASSPLAQKYDIVDRLPIPRTLKLFLMLDS